MQKQNKTKKWQYAAKYCKINCKYYNRVLVFQINIIECNFLLFGLGHRSVEGRPVGQGSLLKFWRYRQIGVDMDIVNKDARRCSGSPASQLWLAACNGPLSLKWIKITHQHSFNTSLRHACRRIPTINNIYYMCKTKQCSLKERYNKTYMQQ